MFFYSTFFSRQHAFVNIPRISNLLFHEVGIPHVPHSGLKIFTDTWVLRESNLGVLEEAAIYSDANNLKVQSNRIELVKSGAFDASVRKFEFVGNTVDFIENNGSFAHQSLFSYSLKLLRRLIN